MLRNLLQEIVRRRLWPIPALALIAIVVAPVLFLKSAPAGAPAAATAAPAPATAGKLPARAQRLLEASTGSRSGGATGDAQDPFQPPAAQRAAAAAATKATTGDGSGASAGTKTGSSSGSGAGTPTTSAPIPVVIQNPDGSAVTTTTTPSPTGSGSGARAGTAAAASVDVRFGPSAGTRLHRAIPRLKTFYIHGKLAAVFVKYSPSRNKAVFAVSPDVLVTGPVKCRRKEGVCRYIDIPAGSFARLSALTKDRILVSRRLDVERINRGPSAASTTAVAAGDRSVNACLLGKLQALRPGGTPIDRDACER